MTGGAAIGKLYEVPHTHTYARTVKAWMLVTAFYELLVVVVSLPFQPKRGAEVSSTQDVFSHTFDSQWTGGCFSASELSVQN